jgi:integration host factor subunit alpha
MSQGEVKQGSRTKADLVDLVYRSHGGLTKHEAAEVVDSIFRTLKTSLLDGQAVKIQNFGVFEVVARQGRMGVDPSSGERIFIPPRNGLTFRPAHRLKEAVIEPDGDS